MRLAEKEKYEVIRKKKKDGENRDRRTELILDSRGTLPIDHDYLTRASECSCENADRGGEWARNRGKGEMMRRVAC